MELAEALAMRGTARDTRGGIEGLSARREMEIVSPVGGIWKSDRIKGLVPR